MSTLISDTAPFAAAVALSPLPIIAIILILLSPRARVNGLAFLCGWILGLAVAEALVLAAVTALNVTPGAGQLKITAVLKVVIGVLLVYLGIQQWRHRPQPGQAPNTPGWMRSIETFTPARALSIAALLSVGGNLALIIAAGVAIARANSGIRQEAGALGFFIAIGSLTVAATLGYHLVAGQTAAKTLTKWKAWLLQNNALVMFVTLVLVGIILLGKGLSALGLFG